MLEVYAGLYKNLTPEQQGAVTDLTVKRYVEDYMYLSDFLMNEMNLKHGSVAFITEYKRWNMKVEKLFSKYDDNTYISAIFLHGNGDAPTPLAAFRTVHGTNNQMSIIET